MAVPKSKLSSARKNSRRSSVWKMSAQLLFIAQKCGEYKNTHVVCGSCGFTTAEK